MMIQQAELSGRTVRMMRKSMAEIFLVPVDRIPRVIFHSVILSFIISSFWLLDSLKDPILANIVGIEYQPTAKFISVLFTLFVVCMYDFATSLVSRPTLFHLVSGIFGTIMMVLSALLADPQTGFENHHKGPHRLLGWACYFAVEAYGSLMVALFWSYTNSIMDLEQAKGAYGLIISTAQIGAILGATLATHASKVGISQLFLVGAMLIYSVSLLIKVYHIIFRDHATEAVKTIVRTTSDVSLSADVAGSLVAPFKMRQTCFQIIANFFGGFYAGVLIICKHRYTLKLLGISCLYEVVLTVLDYEFKVMGADSVADRSIGLENTSLGHQDRFAHLLGHFGQLTNFISFLVSFFGFSFLVHKFDVKVTLLFFPVLLFLAVIVTNLVPTLWVLFVLVSLLKALTFSLSEPVKELLYIPTADPIKFKAKAWIDVFGCRLAKAAGSFITSLSHGDAAKLRAISEIPCIIICIGIVVLAWSIGTEFQWLIKNRVIVGEAGLGSNYTVYDLNDLTSKDTRHGLRPGDVGYDGYDLHLFQGVFEEQDVDKSQRAKVDPWISPLDEARQSEEVESYEPWVLPEAPPETDDLAAAAHVDGSNFVSSGPSNHSGPTSRHLFRPQSND